MARTKKANNDQPESGSKPKCCWTDLDNAIMVRVMAGEKAKGNQAENGWKPCVWTAVSEAVKREGTNKGAEKTPAKCSDHWTNIKSNFKSCQALCAKSGFGWDDAGKLVTATDEVWNAEIKAHPSSARWRKTRFPLFDEILALVDGIIATGTGAFHPGLDAPSSDNELEFSGAANDYGYDDNVYPTFQSLPPNATPEPVSPSHTHSPTPAARDTSTSAPSRNSSASAASHKRTASGSPHSTNWARKRKHNTTADAVEGMSRAVQSLADSFGSSSDTNPNTPQRRRIAIKLLEDDDDLSDSEFTTVVALFTVNVNVAEAFADIGKKSRRTCFIQEQLEEFKIRKEKEREGRLAMDRAMAM